MTKASRTLRLLGATTFSIASWLSGDIAHAQYRSSAPNNAQMQRIYVQQQMQRAHAFQQQQIFQQQQMHRAWAAEQARRLMIQQQQPLIQYHRQVERRSYTNAAASAGQFARNGYIAARGAMLPVPTVSHMRRTGTAAFQAGQNLGAYQRSLESGFRATHARGAFQAQSRQWQHEATQSRMAYSRAQQNFRAAQTFGNAARVNAARGTLMRFR